MSRTAAPTPMTSVESYPTFWDADPTTTRSPADSPDRGDDAAGAGLLADPFEVD